MRGKVPWRDGQSLALTLAGTLLIRALGGVHVMMDRKAQVRERLRQQSESKVDGVGSAATPVIVLDDRSTGPEAENHRLKAQLASLNADLDKLRAENQKLISDKQILNTELLEMKLLMSKLQVDELRGLERNNFWLRPFKTFL